MDIATIIVLIAVLLMVLAYVAQPLVLGGGRAEGRPGQGRDALRRRADLLAERNRLYAEIRALDFDHSTNQVADADWDAQRHALVAQGVEVLRQLDALPGSGETAAADPIEAAVRALRSGEAVTAPAPAQSAKAKPAPARRGKSKPQPQPAETNFCPHCGQPVEPTDQFCAACGNRL